MTHTISVATGREAEDHASDDKPSSQATVLQPTATQPAASQPDDEEAGPPDHTRHPHADGLAG